MEAKDTFFYRTHLLNCNGKLLDISTPVVMGILNLAADSFYDGGRFADRDKMIDHVGKMLEEGAAIIDIGGQSTRPGAGRVDEKTEASIVIPALQLLKNKFPGDVFSVDTFYSSVAEAAIKEGAAIVNDVSGGTMDTHMFEIVARYKVPYVLMHMQGTPETMQKNPTYKNVTNEVMDFLAQKISVLHSSGVNDIIIDPGFGFGKTLEHNYSLLAHLELLKIFELPVLCGLSRKSMVGRLLNISPNDALNGTTVLNTIALLKGANILRVHDVKEAVEAVKIVNSLH